MAAAMNLADKLGAAAAVDASLSTLARGVVGSEILRIAAEIRALKAKGAQICNLTVGDFDPAQFPVPDALLDGRARGAGGRAHQLPAVGRRARRCARRWRASTRARSGSRTRSSRC